MSPTTRRTSLFALTGAPLALAACATSGPAPGAVTPARYAAWLDRYKHAWETRDPAAAGALFTVDASYHEMPFNAPLQGRAAIEAYWAGVTANQANVRFTYEVIGCGGEEAIAHWHASFTAAPGGETIDLDGVFICRFADERTVSALREWWHVRVAPTAN